MPEELSPAGSVIEALGYALFLRDPAGVLRLEGEVPEWLGKLWPSASARGAELPRESPFLENFLFDAEACWAAGAEQRAESGPWVERDANGEEAQLQARALTAGGRACLLVERLGAEFASKVAVLQKARETVIALQRLDAEIQKKEILVHCLAEDLSKSLGNIVTALRLMEREDLSAKLLPLLNLAVRSAEEQRGVIEKVLGLFPEELSGLYGRGEGAVMFADLRSALRRAVESLSPHFSEKGVRCSHLGESAEELRVRADERYASRVVENLLRIALENSPSGSEVVVRMSLEDEAAMLAVEFPQELREWEKEDVPRQGQPEVYLRLRFCRVAVENCRGEMGFRAREGGGTCAWVRLPRWSDEG